MKRLLGTLLAACVVTSAHASPVTTNLSGTIDEIGQNYFGGGVVDDFTMGETVSISVTYDAQTPNPAIDPNGYSYIISQFTLSTPIYSATVDNHGGLKLYDEYRALWMTSGYNPLTSGRGMPLAGVPLLDGDYLYGLSFSMIAGNDGLVLGTLDQPFDMSQFSLGRFAFWFAEPGTTRPMGTMQGMVTSLTTAPASGVPEPSSMALFGLGAAGILARRRRAA
jgi:hypothetical protein